MSAFPNWLDVGGLLCQKRSVTRLSAPGSVDETDAGWQGSTLRDWFFWMIVCSVLRWNAALTRVGLQFHINTVFFTLHTTETVTQDHHAQPFLCGDRSANETKSLLQVGMYFLFQWHCLCTKMKVDVYLLTRGQSADREVCLISRFL